MGSLYAKDVIETALSEVGYQADGKWNKFADVLDSVDYFTGCGKKQGLDWCAVFVCYCAYMNTRNVNGDIEPDVWDAHYFLYQSDSCDMAAVVKYLAQYFKDNDAWTDNPERGDIAIYQKSNGVYYHTGIVTDWDWDNDKIYITEGNTNGGQVATKEYSFKDIGGRIAGFGRPRYDGWELEQPNDSQEKPTPEPTPEPATPVGKKYEVCVNSFLNIRTGPSTSYPSIWKLYNGDDVTVYEENDGWGKINAYEDQWVCMKYLEPVY